MFMTANRRADMTTYEIVADTARTFALRNKATGQFEHDGFPSKALVRSFFELHFGWRTASDPLGQYKLEN